jgi:hypothetical protein
MVRRVTANCPTMESTMELRRCGRWLSKLSAIMDERRVSRRRMLAVWSTIMPRLKQSQTAANHSTPIRHHPQHPRLRNETSGLEEWMAKAGDIPTMDHKSGIPPGLPVCFVCGRSERFLESTSTIDDNYLIVIQPIHSQSCK